VTELVDEDQDADDDDEGQDSGHAAVPPRRESIRCWTTRRVSASTSTTPRFEPSSPAGAVVERLLDELRDVGESDPPVEERGYRHLVPPRVRTTDALPAALERGPRQPEARELVRVGLEERQLGDAREIEPGRRRRPRSGYVSA